MAEGTARARIERQPEGRFVRLRNQLGVSSFGLNEIVLRPGERGRIHRHERQEEVFLVLEGELTIAIAGEGEGEGEGEDQKLAQGELLRVAPALKRQLVNASDADVIVLALGGYGEHEGRDAEAFESWDQSDGRSPRDVPLPDDLT